MPSIMRSPISILQGHLHRYTGRIQDHKIKSIARTRGLNPSKILENTTVAKAGTTSEQEQCIESAKIKIKSESDVKLLILDSMTHLYKLEYPERSSANCKTVQNEQVFAHVIADSTDERHCSRNNKSSSFKSTAIL